MSGEHEDHDNETREGEPHVAEAERTGRPDDESGPRVSAHPVVEDFSDSYPEDDEQRGQAHQHRSGPPPKPRLKDSKYPPPAASADASAPPPRKKVISS